jgi:hypothetical protein
MTLASNFLDFVKERDAVLHRAIDEIISIEQVDKRLRLTIYNANKTLSIEQLNKIQGYFSEFVPASHIGFTAAPLLVTGTQFHSIEIQWSHGREG